MEEVEFAGRGWLKEKDLLWVWRRDRYGKTTQAHAPSLPLNEVKDELGDLRSLDGDKAVRFFDSFFPHGESDLDDEACDPFEKDRDEGELAENGSSFQSSELGFVKDLQVLFGSAVQPFGSGAERSEGLVARGSTDHFSNQPGVLFDGHMLDESVVIDEERTGLGVFF